MGLIKRSRKKKKGFLLGRRKRRRNYLVFILFIFVCLVLISGVVFLLRYEKLQIRSIDIQGGSNVDHEEVKRTVEDVLEGYYLWIIPRRNIIVYPHDEIQKKIRHSFPRIQHVELSRDLFSGIDIGIHEYRPYGVWCHGMPSSIAENTVPGVSSSTPQKKDEHDSSSCYYITKKGFLYLEAPSFSGDVYLTLYGGDASYRHYMLPPTIFTELVVFIERVTEQGFRPSSLSVVEEGTVVISLKGGGMLVLDRDQSFAQAYSNLGSVIHDPEVAFVPLSENRTDLQYIDLRFEDRVFYKMK